jgi:hypothetical protein
VDSDGGLADQRLSQMAALRAQMGRVGGDHPSVATHTGGLTTMTHLFLDEPDCDKSEEDMIASTECHVKPGDH